MTDPRRLIRRGGHQSTSHDTGADTCANHYKCTTKARASSCARRNARPHSRSHPARPQSIPRDCPGHLGRHLATCPHAAAQTLPVAVARRHSSPPAPQLPIRRRRTVLPRGRPANHGCKLVCWFGTVCAGVAQCGAALVSITRLTCALSKRPPKQMKQQRLP